MWRSLFAKFWAPFAILRNNFQLIFQLAKRDVLGRYRGSLAGLFWSFFNPLLLLAVYTFVFGVIFRSRWQGQAGGQFEFAIILFAGMNMHGLLAECANRAPTLVLENVNFVKKVVFPIEVLSWVVVGSALFHLLVSTIALLLFSFVINGGIPWTALLFPLVALAFVPFVLGLTWLLSALGVFLRDMKQIVGVVTAALLFLAPIFYPISYISEQYRWVLYLNPLTFFAEAARSTLVWGGVPDIKLLLPGVIFSLVMAWVGLYVFTHTKKAFADVL